MDSHNILQQCPLCSSGSIKQYWKKAKVWKCASCALLFRNPLTSQVELDALYENSWTNPTDHNHETGGTDERHAQTYLQKLLDTLHLKNLQGVRILEFGAGKGEMLDILEKNGAEVFAVEPFGYDYLLSKGVNVFRTLDDIPSGMTFDGIISIDVIEHIAYPWVEIKKMNEFVKPKGWIFLSTFNAAGLNAQVTRSQWREVVKTSHLIFFTPQNLEHILLKSGYNHYERLQWFINYGTSILSGMKNFALQGIKLDGELRYMIWKE